MHARVLPAVDVNDGVYVYTGSMHEHRVPEGVTKVACSGDVEVIRSAAFSEVRPHSVSSVKHSRRGRILIPRRRLIRPRRT